MNQGATIHYRVGPHSCTVPSPTCQELEGQLICIKKKKQPSQLSSRGVVQSRQLCVPANSQIQTVSVVIKKKAYLLELVFAVLGALYIKSGGRQRQQLASSLSGMELPSRHFGGNVQQIGYESLEFRRGVEVEM